jgi:hypothetical protein
MQKSETRGARNVHSNIYIHLLPIYCLVYLIQPITYLRRCRRRGQRSQQRAEFPYFQSPQRTAATAASTAAAATCAAQSSGSVVL